jgi:hypothetical protein
MRGVPKASNSIELLTTLEAFHDLYALATGPGTAKIRVDKAALNALLTDNRRMLQALLQAGVNIKAQPPKLRRQALTE